jgi:hypothetical protein
VTGEANGVAKFFKAVGIATLIGGVVMSWSAAGKQFSFEKENQKTFASLDPEWSLPPNE